MKGGPDSLTWDRTRPKFVTVDPKEGSAFVLRLNAPPRALTPQVSTSTDVIVDDHHAGRKMHQRERAAEGHIPHSRCRLLKFDVYFFYTHTVFFRTVHGAESRILRSLETRA